MTQIDPANIARFRAQLDAAIAELSGEVAPPAEDRHHIVARAALGEALSKLMAYGELTDAAADALREEHLVSPPASLPLRTRRLTIRPISLADVEALVPTYADEQTAQYLLGPAMSPAQVEAMVRRKVEPEHPTRAGQGLQLVAERDGEVVGDFFIQLLDPGLVTAEVGWVFSPKVTGRGYATEAMRATLDLAFNHFRLHRAIANLDARNDASARLCERLGMRRESHKVDDYWSRGEFTSSFEYAVLAREWRGLRTTPSGS